MNMESPAVSVIVPVYKAEKYLRKCVDSILAQTFRDFEVLLVDDGSPDKSGAICDEYARKDPRVRVFHKENGGVSSARQCGLDHARGEYTIQVDSDDWIESSCLSEMLEFAYRQKVDIVIASGIYMDKCSSVIHSYYPEWSCERIIQGFLRRELFVGMVNKLIRREVYVQNNIAFPVGYDYGEDCYVLCCLLLHTNRVAFIDRVYYHYCDNPTSLTTNRWAKKNFESRFWWISQLEEQFKGNASLLNALMQMKIFVKEDAYQSGLYNQKEFDKIYPEVNDFISKSSLRYFRKVLLRLAVHGKSEQARLIMNSRLLQGGVACVRRLRNVWKRGHR